MTAEELEKETKEKYLEKLNMIVEEYLKALRENGKDEKLIEFLSDFYKNINPLSLDILQIEMRWIKDDL